MEKDREKRKKNKLLYLGTAVFFTASAGLQLAARNILGFGEWYGLHIYPVLVGILGRISGVFPFSLVEWGLYLLIAGLTVWVIRQRREPVRVMLRLLFLTSVLLFSYTINCGINYYRTPFSEKAGLKIRESSVEELKELCLYLTEQIVQMEESGVLEDQSITSMTASETAKAGCLAMERLGTVYSELQGYYPRPKPVCISQILSVQQLAGIYSPFTIEANYNKDMTGYNIPHTVCHELSHLRGFMREDEANFIGYLACIQSEEPWFRYSGYVSGWIYAGNALAKEDMEAYMEIYRMLPEKTVKDLQDNNRFWDRYEGKAAEAAEKINDTYLKMNSQEDGVKSYGRAVDLMLSYYRK